jgi:hypothetical protein
MCTDGRLFGFWASLDPPLNNRSGMITKEQLMHKIKIMSEFNKNQICFLQAHECGDRHLYQKSPYRRKEKKQRIFDILPDSFFKVIGFGFPEDENMGEDSSEDEEEMMKR